MNGIPRCNTHFSQQNLLWTPHRLLLVQSNDFRNR
jgi:hypothetical protein